MTLPEFDESLFFEQKSANRLGAGSFGTVYKVNVQGKNYAYKMFHKPAKDEDMIKAEIVNLSRIGSHPNIIAIHGQVFRMTRSGRVTSGFLMELVEGPGSLGDVIQQAANGESTATTKLRDDDVRLQLMIGLARGLAHLHSKNIFHRDLKPDNVMLTDGFVPKIADFGLGRNMTYSNRATVTSAGTVGFMAPEMLDQNFDPTARTLAADVFSFGIICWTVFAVQDDPYPDIMSDRELLAKYTSGSPIIPVQGSWPQKVQTVINRTTSVSPKDRPSIHNVLEYLNGGSGLGAAGMGGIYPRIEDKMARMSIAASSSSSTASSTSSSSTSSVAPSRNSQSSSGSHSRSDHRHDHHRRHSYDERSDDDKDTEVGVYDNEDSKYDGESVFRGPQGGLYFWANHGRKQYVQDDDVKFHRRHR
jgi:serine/threonine protein kinase